MTSEEVFTVLRDVILSVTGVEECIQANPNGQAPAGGYASVLVSDHVIPQSRGSVYQKVDEAAGIMEYQTKFPAVRQVTVNFWRGKAVDRAAKLTRIHYLPAVADRLFAAGIGIADVSAVQNLTALQSNQMEQRAAVTMSVVTMEEVSETVGIIKHLNGIVVDEKNRKIQHFEV